jgi:mono/diheme cytochrome c family protein
MSVASRKADKIRKAVFAFSLLAFGWWQFVCDRSKTFADGEDILTYTKDVAPIFQRNCVSCHRSGGIAQMPLTNFKEVRPYADRIKKALAEKHVPPWNAVPGYGDFINTHSLSQRETELIFKWIEGGAAEGDPKDAKPSSSSPGGWSLGTPDLILRPESPYNVAPGKDAYQEFLLPTNLTGDRWLSAIDLLPGNASVVHCASFSLEPPSRPQQTRTGKVNNQLSASHAYSSRRQLLGTWMPGQKTVTLPDGVAQRLSAGSQIVLTVHYHGSVKATQDRSALGLYFAKTAVRQQLRAVEINSSDVLVPVGGNPAPVMASYMVQNSSQAIAITPRVHPLMLSLEATAYRPDGTVEVLIWTRGYRFDWQPTYYFRQPVDLPKGTRIELKAYFDGMRGNPNGTQGPPRQSRASGLDLESLCSLFVTEQANGTSVNPTGPGHRH